MRLVSEGCPEPEMVVSSGIELNTMANDLSSLCVLVVDDKQFSRTMVATALNSIGVENITSAADGQEALISLEAASADLVICDLNMPEMDGIEFLRHLAEAGFKGGVVLVSGEDRRILDTAESLAGAHNLNVLGAVEKPIKAATLADILGRRTAADGARGRKLAERVSESELKSAIESDELIVFYQPKVDVATGSIFGAESLVRWQRPDGSMIPPDAFIPVAEEHGLIDELTRVVFTKAVRQVGVWFRTGLELKIAVNVSMKNLEQIDFPEFISAEADEAGLGVKNVILEITETQLMQDTITPLEILTRLRLKGIALSIDDFGTGYSSMEQLKSIPFTEMKIDRAFVNGAAEIPATRAILESTVDLAKRLDMSIVAEGVENQDDWDLITELGIDLVQGYFVAKPMPAEAFGDWAANWIGLP